MIDIDAIGALYTSAVLDDDGEVISEGTAFKGFHVNTIPCVPEWEQFHIEPSEKRKPFPGQLSETICYRFPSEEVFKQTLLSYVKYADVTLRQPMFLSSLEESPSENTQTEEVLSGEISEILPMNE